MRGIDKVANWTLLCKLLNVCGERLALFEGSLVDGRYELPAEPGVLHLLTDLAYGVVQRRLQPLRM